MYRSSKSRHFFVWSFFTWWPEMTLTYIMVTKHRKWYLQMSVTLSMPIHWLCLRLTSKFYSPMSPSPKSRKFWLWPDLWRHQWPPGQMFDLVRVVHVHSVYYECLPATTWRYGRVSVVGWIRTEAAGCVGRSGVLSRPWPNGWLLDESGPPWPGWPRQGEARGKVRGRVIMECAVFRQRPGLFALGRGRDISGRFRRCAVGRCKRGIWMLWFTFLGCIL